MIKDSMGLPIILNTRRNKLRDIVRLVGVSGVPQNKKRRCKPMLNKAMNGLTMLALVMVLAVAQAHAEATTYFTLPADFTDSVKLTIVSIAGGLLVILGLMFAWRKTVKSVNRS